MVQAAVKEKPKSAPAGTQDAITLLIADHENVRKMFKAFEKLKKADGKDDARAELVAKICHELTIHVQVEEEIFYPAVRAAIDDDDLMDEAEVEHTGARDLIAQLQDMQPGDDHYDATVKVLGENIEHHVREEQDEMFVKVKKSKVDTAALGKQMMQRKKELLDDGRR